ncbi:MAG TPA: diphthine--ammonia ligase [Acidobacteriota bacterium]
MNNAVIAWSGGKDSVLALQEIRKAIQIEALITTVTEHDRIAMHGINKELILQQARAIGYPMIEVRIPEHCSNDQYELKMTEVLQKYRESGTESVIFGDLFLEDIRLYREDFLNRIGMKGIFPLWKKDTTVLAKQFIDSGFRAIIICVDTQILPKEFAGREFNFQLLNDLPQQVDPCGENGEFHTFVYDGPLFQEPVKIKPGQKFLKQDRFYYCDLLLRSI